MNILKLLKRTATVAVLSGTVLLARAADAQAPVAPLPPPPPPPTIWNFLGVPQGLNKVRDARVNRDGLRPDRERVPPLKRIADPANLFVDNPAIQAAAKIKMDADLAPQKIKAIRYLATVCCGCAKNRAEVKEALLASLDDCTEEVRYEAAIALCQCASRVCSVCDHGSCCDPKVVAKLTKMAQGQDDYGCFFEPSPRVRAAAANALNACQMSAKPPLPETGPKVEGEAPTIATPPGPEPEAPTPAPAVPATKPLAPPAPPAKPVAPPAAKPAVKPGVPTTLVPIPDPTSTTSTGTRMRVVAPAGYNEPVESAATPVVTSTATAKSAKQWPAATPLLDSRWQDTTLKGARSE